MLKSKRIIALIITVLMLVSMLPTLAFADSLSAVTFNETTPADLTFYAGGSSEAVGVFTPQTSGRYVFFGEVVGMNNVTAALWDNADREGDCIDVNFGTSFEIYADLEAGTSYYMFVYCYDIVEENFNVNLYVEKEPEAKSIEIIKYPYDMTVYEGMFDEYYFYGLEIEVTFTDESKEVFYYDAYYDNHAFECYVDDDKNSKTYGLAIVKFDNLSTTFEIEILENPVKKFEYIGKTIEIVEKTHCYDANDGYYIYEVEEILQNCGEVFKVTYKDGTSDTYSIWDYDEFIIPEQYMYMEHSQYEEMWEKGEKKIAQVYYMGYCVNVPFKVVETPVKSIKIDKAPSYVYTFGDMTYGYVWEGSYSFDAVEYDDLKFTVTFKDGSKKTYYGKDIDSYDNSLEGIYCTVDAYVDEAVIGKNAITLNYNGFEVKYNVTVKKSDVKSIKLTKKPTTLVFDDWYRPSFAGAEVTVTKNNGTKTVYKVTKDNIFTDGGDVYVRDEAGNPVLSFVSQFDPDTYEFVNYKIKCYDATVETDCMQYQENVYDSIELKNVNIDFENMSLVVKKGDKKDTIKLVNDVEFYGGGFGGPDMKPIEFCTFTEKGIVMTTVIAYLDRFAPIAYEAGAFGLGWYQEVEDELVLKGISIAKESDKVRYKKGEKFNPKGIEIELDFGNGIKGLAIYGQDDMTISKVDTSKAGTKKVTVTYEGKKASFEIKVADGFSDVKKGSWYESYVNYAASYGIFDGTDEVKNTFSPEDNVTRAQFVKILANIAGVDTSNNSVNAGFKDVPKGKWYTGAVKWAAENGITSGVGNGKFDPEAKITREQMCVMLTSFVEDYMGSDFKKLRAGVSFKDEAKISSWAKDAVDKCQRATLIGGLGDGNFGPAQYATRAQAATIFSTFHEQSPIW